MTKKKSIWAFVLALCLIIPAMFMMTACGNKSISEKGVTYTVLNKQSDITINWGDDKDTIMEEIGSEENAKAIEVIESDDGNQIRYEITANGETYLFIHNNGYKAETLGNIDVSGYEVYLDTNVEEAKTNATLKGSALMPYETLILKK